IAWLDLALFIFLKLDICGIARVTDNAFCESQALVRVISRPLPAIEGHIDIDHGVKRRNGPITAQRHVCARVFQVSPGERNGPALRAGTLRPNSIFFETEGRMTGLHRSNNTQLLEAWHILRLAHFDVFDAVPAVAPSIQLLDAFVTIECLPHSSIAAAMDGDL